jgi:hypothetical protein
MLPGESLLFHTGVQLIVAISGTVITCLLALAYITRVRLERPAIGTFNGRDIAVLFVFIVGLPLLYLVLPLLPLLIFLGITFASALSMGLRPLLGPSSTWLTVGLLIGANIWLTRTMLGTVLGWQIWWLVNSVMIILAAVTVANLYVQGGMRVKHIAIFGVVLAVYDAIFTFVWPVTNQLAQRFIGWPLDPAIGFRIGVFNYSLGLGDLLVYAMFVIGVHKAYGTAATRIALVVAVAFGAVMPAVAPLFSHIFIDARTDLVVPAQVAFGPAAFLCYLWLRRRYGQERTMGQFLAASTATAAPAPTTARHALGSVRS